MTDLNPIIDSAMNLQEALAGIEIPANIKNSLTIIEVQYISFDELLHQGQLVLHKDLTNEVIEIFKEIVRLRFPIQHVIPIVAYAWDDEASMSANNTSAFNYRLIYATNTPSNHSYGRAIDINPLLNPYTAIDGSVQPQGATYEPARPGTIQHGDPLVSAFGDRGWHWLAERDWQHFDKVS
jgi:peptidoglycan L-alanyl-D-glutamate endopeptidase CwlK